MAPKVGQHAAWAMAVGGMIGGGIYTLAGVIIGAAGKLGWVSIAIGAVIALLTVNSYYRLTGRPETSAVPVTVFAREGHRRIARILAWGLLAVYVLSLSVYTYTVGRYVGHATGMSTWNMGLLQAGIVAAVVALNLFHIQHPVTVQIVAVWIELGVLAALAIYGFVDWHPERLTAPGADESAVGVIKAAAMTFIAFEGFEMLAYDLRDLRNPCTVMRRTLPLSILAVATAYIIVTLGAASLVGGAALVEHREAALAVAGGHAAGPAGTVIVTLAACSSAISAINATLFSASRLARTTAERGVLPAWFRQTTRWDAPLWSTVIIGGAAIVVAGVVALEPLVTAASFGFLALFALVNALAIRRWWRKRRSN